MNIYHLCLSEAANYTDRDAYISDLALSSIWEDEAEVDIPPSRLDWLGQLWDAAHRPIKEIASAAGMSQRKLAERFGIPYKTIENWSTGRRDAPAYIRMMMQECLGLVSHEPD